MEQGKKNFFFEVGVFKQGDVLKQMFQKGYKISFRMYLNLCNTKFSRIDLEKRVYKEVMLSLHFSITSFNMTWKSMQKSQIPMNSWTVFLNKQTEPFLGNQPLHVQ